MNIQHLKYAIEVERVGSITEAAHNLFISQPSLSKAIRELEANLGFQVFERTGRGMIPTRKGRQVLNHAYAIMKQMSEIEALSAFDEMEQQTLVLSMPYSEYIASAVAKFSAMLEPQKPTNLRVREASSMRTVDGVADGTFRLGIVRYVQAEEPQFLTALNRRGLKSETVWEFDQMVMMSDRNPLASRASVSAADLEGHMEVVGAEERAFRTAEAGSLRAVRARTFFAGGRAMQTELLRSMPDAYMWAEPMPSQQLKQRALVQRPSDIPGHRMCDRLIYPPDYRFTATERAFINRLFEARNEASFIR